MSFPPTLKRKVRRALNDADYALQLRRLPPRVAIFQLRARLRASSTRDVFSLASATRPPDLARLIALARGRLSVVELGTGTGWTTIALALAEPHRRITSFDPVARLERERYLTLVPSQVRARITFVPAPGATGSAADGSVEMLYVDSSHDRLDTIAELKAWAPALAPGALVVLDDYGHAHFPGVKAAVEELGLSGEQRGTLFVHTHDIRTTLGGIARTNPPAASG